MGLSVSITGLRELQDDMRRAGGNAQPLVKAAVFNSAREIQRNVRREAPHKTGALQGHTLISLDYPTSTVSIDEKYGIFVEKGTAPHLIRARNKQVLANKKLGLIFGKTVHHPGTKANPFFSRGVTLSTSYIHQQFTAVIDRLVKELAGRE